MFYITVFIEFSLFKKESPWEFLALQCWLYNPQEFPRGVGCNSGGDPLSSQPALLCS